MGEINPSKPLYCLICDSDVQINQSYSIFYTFITNSGVLLANSLEKNLSLKDIGSLSLRSTFLCLKCFGYFEQLTDCESKIVKLKCDLWTVYKETCTRHGEEAETHIKGVSTQTDICALECECKSKKSQPVLNLKLEQCDEDKFSNDDGDNDADFDNDVELTERNIKFEGEKPSEEITVDADPHLNDDDSSKWKRRPESCKLCGKWFKKVVELDNHMLIHVEMDREKLEQQESESKTKKKFHSCTVCNKKFRRPCEVKEHMVSHKTVAPFICKYCGKKLKSKTGAIYHTLKAHKIDVAKSKKLEEHFHMDADKDEIVGGAESENEDDNDMKEEPVDCEEDKEDKVLIDDGTSSSEDELPLARRRKEFIFEKIKQEIRTGTEKPEGPDRKQKTMQKQALQALKKWCDVSVTKVSKSSEENSKKKSAPPPKGNSGDGLHSVVEKIDNEEIRSKISDLSKTNEVTIQSKSEISASESDGSSAANVSGDKPRTRTRKYPLSTLLKLKRQKDAGLFPPPMKEPKFKCDVCGKMWKTRGELNAHKITHSDARPYICEICGQAYKHKPALDVHVGMHRGIYHHQCPYCQKAFTQKGALQRHLPIHTGDLPYQCELCGKRFVHRTSFSIHTMAHTGVRNIRCKICNLGVLSKSHLRRHMRIHTGEKPYDCQTCGKAFAERYNLVAHQRIHDPNLVGPARQQKKRLQTCRLCNATFDRRHKLEDHMVTVHNKVVDDAPRPSIFDTGDGFTAPRLMVDRYETRKPQEREEQDDKSGLTAENNPNDLSVRNLQNLQNLRNLELLRNLESSRNFELIRMANGIGGIDETLRIPGAGSGTPWTYVNPGS